MIVTPEQQAIELISRSKRILVATREHADQSAMASACAFMSFMGKIGIRADAVSPGLGSNRPGFLPLIETLKSEIGALRAFELTLDVSTVAFDEMYREVKDGKLALTLLPKSGEWSPKDVAFRHGEDRYDLVIALDCPDRQSLGALFRDHSDFLYRVPVVNVDHDPANEHWGHVNLVDLTAVATTEILHRLFEAWNASAIDEDCATALLAGMVAKTQSFRTSNVTPSALTAASRLMGMGARRQDIIHGLWRTRSVADLKLWGRALSRIEQDMERGIVWIALDKRDFLETGTNPHALDGIVQDLVAYAPEAKTVVLAHETEDGSGVHVVVHAVPPRSAIVLCRPFNATGTRDRAEFNLPTDTGLAEHVRRVVCAIGEAV